MQSVAKVNLGKSLVEGLALLSGKEDFLLGRLARSVGAL